MPTLVWVHRSEIGRKAAGGEASALPDLVSSAAAVSESVVPAVPAVPGTSSVQAALSAECRERKKRKLKSVKAATSAKKIAKATSKRDLPRGVWKLPSGKFASMIGWGGTTRYIGSFDTPEQASSAYVTARKDLAGANLSTLSAEEVNAAFDAAKKKALIRCSQKESARLNSPNNSPLKKRWSETEDRALRTYWPLRGRATSAGRPSA